MLFDITIVTAGSVGAAMNLDQALLGDLYAAAECPARWPRLLDGLCAGVGMRSAVAQILDIQAERSQPKWCARDGRSQFDAVRHDRFINTPGNPRFDARLRRDPAHGIGSDVRSFGASPLLLADLRQRLDRGGLGGAVWLSFPIAPRRAFTLILHRQPGDYGDLRPAEEKYLETLMPHLMRAIRLSPGLTPIGADPFRAALGRLQNPVMLLGAGQQVDWFNDAAERLLRRAAAVRVVAGRLDCAEPGDGRRLRDRIAQVRARALPTATLAVGRGGAMPLHLRVEPLGNADDAEPAIALFLAEPGEALALDPAALAALFGLTPAEAQLAAALGAGASIADHAAQRGITVGTARIQLKQVLAKTGTARQSELIRRLCNSLAAISH
jgi:DNA-binding CsgD family transcriptional regulator